MEGFVLYRRLFGGSQPIEGVYIIQRNASCNQVADHGEVCIVLLTVSKDGTTLSGNRHEVTRYLVHSFQLIEVCGRRAVFAAWKLQDADQYVVVSEESGTARCPFEQTHNSTTLFAGILCRLSRAISLHPYCDRLCTLLSCCLIL